MTPTRPQRGFVVVEGVEGSGKSTLAARLARLVEAEGFEVVLTYEPGATSLGESIRKILLDRRAHLDELAELNLYLADRAQHVSETIRPALGRGAVVVCDRFSPSTIAYQGAGRGLGIDWVKELCSKTTRGIEPDLVLVLDLPPLEGLARLGGFVDRMESEPMDFHERVRAAYLDLASENPDRYVVVDASLAPEEVERRAWKVVRERILEGDELHDD